MSTTAITITGADDVSTSWDVHLVGDRPALVADLLDDALGWTLKPQGLCRGEVCVPTAAHPELIAGQDDRGVDLVDLETFARLTDQPMVADLDEGLVTFGVSASTRAEQRRSLEVPDLEVPDLDGNPVNLRGIPGKKLLVAFASWCGCRYDLPAWQAIRDELAPEGFSAIAVAVDEDPEDVRPWVADVDLPVVIDRDRTVTEHFDIRNVPTVIWIDEHDRVVRPNDVAFGSDEFKEFHGVDSEPHRAALRRWVRDDELELDDDGVRGNLFESTADEQLARVHWRVAIALHRQGRSDAAARHFARAGELAPHDFTIRRAALPLQGIDPFLSEEFIELYTGFQEAGQPDYGFSQSSRPASGPG